MDTCLRSRVFSHTSNDYGPVANPQLAEPAMNITYLCNSFPESSETYVADEIRELRRNSAEVFPWSVLRPNKISEYQVGLDLTDQLPLPLAHWKLCECDMVVHTTILRDS